MSDLWGLVEQGAQPLPAAAGRRPFKPHLRQRWEQGATNASQLYRGIRALGFAGSYALVRDYLEHHRRAPEPMAPVPPTVRQVTGWLTRHPDQLTEDEHLRLKAVLEQCPELRAAAGHIRPLREMLTNLGGQARRRGSPPSGPTPTGCPGWAVRRQAGARPGCGDPRLDDSMEFRADRRPREPYSKVLKRQMFGRAGLPLLREQVLLTASRQ